MTGSWAKSRVLAKLVSTPGAALNGVSQVPSERLSSLSALWPRGFFLIDFEISDSLRAYCLKRWGCATLPDAFKQPFLDHARARDPAYKNLNQALRNWIVRESPSAKYYSANKWEAALTRARSFEQPSPARARPVIQQPGSTWQPAPAERGPVPIAAVLARLDLSPDEKKPPGCV